MRKRKFRKLFDEWSKRIEEKGSKKATEYFLGYVEGLGKGKLTGYQIGAMVNLFLIPEEKTEVENVDTQEKATFFAN